MKKDYEFIDHTADIAITVRGTDLRTLFLNCAYALFDLLFNGGDINGSKEYTITAEGSDKEELLINFLRELFFKFAVYKIVLKDIKLVEFGESSVTAKVKGEKYDPKRHKLNIDIKAVTYHDVNITETGAGLSVSIVFDT